MKTRSCLIACGLLVVSAASSAAEDKPVTLRQSSPEEMSRCYAASARRAGSEGKIQITATIEPDGSVSNVQVPPGTEPWQENTARCVVKVLRFEAAVKDGAAARSQVVIPLDFDLTGEPIVLPPTLQAWSPAAIGKCYPESAWQEGKEGQVLVTANIEADGSLRDFELPIGISRWQEMTANCVMRVLKFQPATRDGVPVAGRATFPISFNMLGGTPIEYFKIVSTQAEFEAANRTCYPPDLRATATPKYRATITRRGKATKIEVVESTGDDRLDAVGVCVLKLLKFQPSMRGNDRLESTAVFPVPLNPPS